MNAPVAVAQHRADANSSFGIIDCDIHPFPKEGAIARYLPERWRRHVAEYGQMAAGMYAARGTYPRFQPYLSRRDSFPPNGGPPGSDVDFIRSQLLDAYKITYGVLEPLLGGNTSRNLDEAAALSTAMNDWQAMEFVDPSHACGRRSWSRPKIRRPRFGKSNGARATGGSVRSSSVRRLSNR